jgi:site-specific recombinase XerD
MSEIERTSTGLAPVGGIDHTISQSTWDRIDKGTSDNTKRAYKRQGQQFVTWCAVQGRTALPCTAETLAEYVSHLCDLDLGPASIEQAIATIRTAHRLSGFEHQPDTAQALKVLRGHKRQRAEQGTRKRKAPPITLEILRRMIDATNAETLTGLRDRVMLVLGFALMGRRSELAALNVTDVVETEDGLEILIRMSKTDQDAKGETVVIPRGSHAATDPVRVVRTWLEALAERGITAGPLLRNVNRHGQPGEAISGDAINQIVRTAALRADVPNAATITAHSLRAGGATAAYKNGAPVSVIAGHGRWSENSPVVLGYIRAVDKWTDNPMRGLL